jgi:lipoprotein-anchoring transpeptidase ErfK/SrfK
MSALSLRSGWGRAALSIAMLLLAVPAAMAEAFTPGSFQIFGGMDGASGDIAAAQRDDAAMPEHLRSRVVDFASPLVEGSILVKTGARRLYFILPGGKAIEYHVGVGREGFTWSGTNVITRKAEWPDWRPPAEMIARERSRGHVLAPLVPGGPGNPLGARALYIGDTLFRIHGTTEPWSIGQAVSSGCIRMVNSEVIDLYDRVALGATVVVEE